MSLASDAGDNALRAVPPPEWHDLEGAVRRLLAEYEDCRARASRAESRVTELESAVSRISSGALDPMALSAELEALREENRRLQTRLESAAEGVRRIVRRLEFMRGGR